MGKKKKMMDPGPEIHAAKDALPCRAWSHAWTTDTLARVCNHARLCQAARRIYMKVCLQAALSIWALRSVEHLDCGQAVVLDRSEGCL